MHRTHKTRNRHMLFRNLNQIRHWEIWKSKTPNRQIIFRILHQTRHVETWKSKTPKRHIFLKHDYQISYGRVWLRMLKINSRPGRHLRVNLLCLTMPFRLETAGRKIGHSCPVTQLACDRVMLDHVLSSQECGPWGLALVPCDKLRVNSLCLTVCVRLALAGHGVCGSGPETQFARERVMLDHAVSPSDWLRIPKENVSIWGHDAPNLQMKKFCHKTRAANPTTRNLNAKEHGQT